MTLVESGTFARELRAEVAASRWAMVRHPFMQGVAAGTVPLRQIQGWAGQDYHYRRAVPRLAMLRYLRCTDPEMAARLYEVVEEEAAGLHTGSAGHTELFFDFARAVGLSREELETTEMLPGTAAHVYWAELILYQLPWFLALAAQLGGEGQAPPALAMIGRGLVEHYGLAPEAVRFFTVHSEADEDHGSLAEDIARRYLVTPELQAQARAVVLRKVQLQYDMFDTYRFF
jgi:pyrroloquinoline-quinone synthase